MSKRSFWDELGDFFINLVSIRQRARIESSIREEAFRNKRREEDDKLRREVVYQADLGLSRISKYVEVAPAGVLVSLSLLEAMFDDCGVFPSNFLDLSYKRASTRLRNEVHQIMEASEEKMDETELVQARQYLSVSRQVEGYSKRELQMADQYIERVCKEDKSGKSLDVNLIALLLPQELWQKLADSKMAGVI